MHGQIHGQGPRGCKNGHGPMTTVQDPDTGIHFEVCTMCGCRGYDPGEFEAVSALQLRLHGIQVTQTPVQVRQQYSQPQYRGGAHLLGGMFGGQQQHQQLQYGTGIVCPVCGCQMRTLPYPGTNIKVELCTEGCRYLILDAGESEAIILEQLRAHNYSVPMSAAQVVQHYAQPSARRGTHMRRPLLGHHGHGGHHAPRRHGHGSYSAHSGGGFGGFASFSS